MSLPASLPIPTGPQMEGVRSLAQTRDEIPTWEQVIDTLLFRAGYNTTWVMIGTTLLGIAAGIIGCYALLRKRSLVADALSHATLPGIAIAFIVSAGLGAAGKSVGVLLLGGASTGILGVLVIQAIHRHRRVGQDAAIGIVLSSFFGAGIVLLSVVQTMEHGGQGGLAHFIYGQTAAMSRGDALLMAGIAGISLVSALLLLKEFALVAFNEGFARVSGWPVTMIDVIVMGLIVLVTVAGLQAVGLILVVAMLIIPAAAARFWTERLRLLILVSALIGGLSGYAGSAMSALLPRKPAGSVIVLCAGGVFVLSMLFAPRRGVLGEGLRRMRLRWRIARDHLLEHLHERRESGLGALPTRDLARAMRGRGWSPLRSWILVRLFAARGYVRVEASSVALSERGELLGARIARNHALWEQYLISHADVAPSHVDWAVDQVEHVLDEGLIRELERAMGARLVGSAGGTTP